MGRLHWRERGGVIGCRRGWWRVVAFLLFVTLAGYFGLYAVLRVNDEIRVTGHKEWEPDGPAQIYAAAWGEWRGDLSRPHMMRMTREVWDAKWPQWSKTLMVMWPAVKLEAALDRRGWLPWTNIRLVPILPPPPMLPPVISPIPESPSADENKEAPETSPTISTAE